MPVARTPAPPVAEMVPNRAVKLPRLMSPAPPVATTAPPAEVETVELSLMVIVPAPEVTALMPPLTPETVLVRSTITLPVPVDSASTPMPEVWVVIVPAAKTLTSPVARAWMPSPLVASTVAPRRLVVEVPTKAVPVEPVVGFTPTWMASPAVPVIVVAPAARTVATPLPVEATWMPMAPVTEPPVVSSIALPAPSTKSP